MKKWCLIWLLLVAAGSTIAQSTIAKLKYEEAEEAFAANDFSTTLTKLDETEKLLGSVNPRILYLRIAAADQLRKTAVLIEIEAIAALKKDCSTYLVKYENVEGIEEKYKEVYKISEALKWFNIPEDALVNKSKELPADMLLIGQACMDVKNYAAAYSYFTKAAAKNNAEALLRVGLMHYAGNYVAENNNKAWDYFQKAVAMNEPGAMFYTGIMYMQGYSVTKDSVKAQEWLTKAYEIAMKNAANGNGRSLFLAAQALMYMTTGEVEKYIDLYQQAADKGYRNALSDLANIYSNGSKVTANPAKALSLYKKSAMMGCVDDMRVVGAFYYNGKGVDKDLAKAGEWYQLAVEHGDNSAAYSLGLMYANATGVERDYAKAIAYYTLSTERGNRNACNNLGVLYANGNGVTKDFSKALRYYEKAGDQGNYIAMNNAGCLYRDGAEGVPVNYAKALEWFKKGAEAGSVWATYNYGKMHDDAKGVAQNYAVAIEYYNKAAEKENTDAMDRLYAIYYYGYGVKRDKKLAEFWINKSSALKVKK